MSETTVSSRTHHIPVVIYCGGFGTRMRGGTTTKKELVEVGGRPIIWHVMRIFSAYGYNHFILPLGYAGHEIRRYFLEYAGLTRDVSLYIGDGKSRIEPKGSAEHSPWRIDMVDTGVNTDKASRLRKVKDFINADRFFVTYGDGVSNVDVTALVRFHEWHGKNLTMTAVQPASYQYGTVQADANGLINEYTQYPPMPYWINAGFMLFEKAVLDMIGPGDDVALETDIMQTLVANEQMMMYRHHGFWQSMDTLKDTVELETRWKKDAPWKVW